MFHKTLIKCIATIFLAPIILILVWRSLHFPQVSGFLASPVYHKYTPLIFLLGMALPAICALIQYQQGTLPENLVPRGIWKTFQMVLAYSVAGLVFQLSLPYLLFWITPFEVTSIETNIVKAKLQPSRKSPCKAELYTTFNTGLLSKICISQQYAKSLKEGGCVALTGYWNANIGIFPTQVSTCSERVSSEAKASDNSETNK